MQQRQQQRQQRQEQELQQTDTAEVCADLLGAGIVAAAGK